MGVEWIGPFGVVLVLMYVHLTVDRWAFLRGKYGKTWLSIAAGTALAYVFTYLLPKLAKLQGKLADSERGEFFNFLNNHVYLLALFGLLTFFGLAQMANSHDRAREMQSPWVFVSLLLAFGLYNFQLGYLAAEFHDPGYLSVLLAAVVLGVHIMGINHAIFHQYPVIYRKVLKWVFATAVFIGWAFGMLTSDIVIGMIVCNAFVAGGIIINSLHEELPGGSASNPLAFYLSVLVACCAILLFQHLQVVR